MTEHADDDVPAVEDWLTKDKLIEALKDLPGNTHLEIHVQECSCQPKADYEIKVLGRVLGSPDEEPWFTLSVGEFICNCLRDHSASALPARRP